MLLSIKARLAKSPNSDTRLLTIPASLASDSQFPFGDKDVQEVTVSIDTKNRSLVVTTED